MAYGTILNGWARALIASTGERWWEPEVHRLLGELRVDAASHDASTASLEQARDHFQRAPEIAQGQSSKALELRAATSLLRLARRDGSCEAAAARERLVDLLGEPGTEADGADARLATELLEDPGTECNARPGLAATGTTRST